MNFFLFLIFGYSLSQDTLLFYILFSWYSLSEFLQYMTMVLKNQEEKAHYL